MQIKLALRYGAQQLCDSPTAYLDSRILLCHVLDLSHEQLLTRYDNILTDIQIQQFYDLIKQRASMEPIAYIIGSQEFYGRSFTVNNDVLIPRPETELLIESLIGDYKDINEETKILELGTGSGAISVTIAAELKCVKITAVDICAKALAVAQINASYHRVDDKINFIQSNWYDNVPPAEFSYIISNPPYIASSEQIYMGRSTLAFEPPLALYAAHEGLAAYQTIIPFATKFLAKKGKILLEIGFNQAAKVIEILEDCDFKDINILRDLAGHNRVVIAQSK